MKKLLPLILALALIVGIVPSATAVNEDVSGTLLIYTSMYQFVIDMMDEAIKAEFPNLEPGNDGSFFFYGGTGSLQTKIARDDDSSEMLDIIFNNRVFDWGDTIWCDIIRDQLRFMMEQNDRDLASHLAAIEPKVEAKIEETLKIFSDLD